jgi:hypothetical protein
MLACILVIDGGRNENALLKLDVSITTVATKRDGVSDDVTAGVRQSTKVSDLQVLLQQVETAMRRV